MHCDAALHKVETFERGEPVEIRSFKGRGGTNFRPPFQWVKDTAPELACLIYLTDLEIGGDWPEPPHNLPVLWVSTSRRDPAPFGQTIQLEVEA